MLPRFASPLLHLPIRRWAERDAQVAQRAEEGHVYLAAPARLVLPLGAQAPLAQRFPQQLALGRLDDEIVELLGGQEMLARGVQEREAPPLARGDGPGQPLQRAGLDAVRVFWGGLMTRAPYA